MKIKTIICLFGLIIILSACKSDNRKYNISGNVKNAPPGTHVSLIYYKNIIVQADVTADSTTLDAEGNFKLLNNLEQPQAGRIVIGEQYSDMWLCNTDSLYLTVDYKKFDESLHYSGRGSADNNYLAREMKENFVNKAANCWKMSGVKEFINYVDSLEKANQKFLILNDNPLFSSSFRNEITVSTKYRYFYPRDLFAWDCNSSIPTRKKGLPLNYFNYLETLDLNNMQAAGNPTYNAAVDNYFHVVNNPWVLGRIYPDSASISERDEMLCLLDYNIRKSILKGKVLDFNLTNLLRTYFDVFPVNTKAMKSLLNDYRITCKNPEYVSIINKMYATKNMLTEGSQAPDFTLINLKGEQVSLSSLKGKTLLIDFWATWCKPCIASFTTTQKMLEKFKDRSDIIYLYVNVGDDIERWKSYVTKNGLKGTHLFANKSQSANIFTDYAFNDLPHFVIIDKQGKIALSNSASPEQALQKLSEIIK